jgi:hypothetical protein
MASCPKLLLICMFVVEPCLPAANLHAWTGASNAASRGELVVCTYFLVFRVGYLNLWGSTSQILEVIPNGIGF